MAQIDFNLYLKGFPRSGFTLESEITSFIKEHSEIIPKNIRIFNYQNALTSIRAKLTFNTLEETKKVKDKCNFATYKGKEIQIMNYIKIKEKFENNLFLKDLGPDVKSKDLYEEFKQHGDVFSCIAFYDPSGKCKGKGSVCFENKEDSVKVLELNNIYIKGKKIEIEKYKPKINENNIYISDIPLNFSEEKFIQEAQKYGKIQSHIISKPENKNIFYQYAFVSYEKPEESNAAIEGFKSFSFEGKKFNATMAYSSKRNERKRYIKDYRKIIYKDRNYLVKPLPPHIDDYALSSEFSKYGNVTSARVMKDRNNPTQSFGFGFVCFTSVEEGQKAIANSKGIIFGDKNIVAMIPKTKEYPRPMVNRYGPNQRMGQKFHMGYDFRPMGNRGGNRNYRSYMPMMPPYPMNQQVDMKNFNSMNMNNPMMYQFMAPIQRMPIPISMNMNIPVQSQNLNPIMPHLNYQAPPEHSINDKNDGSEKQDLGELLYNKIEKIDSANAAKITGMLLEMDQDHIKNLINDDMQLGKWIEEARQVLNQPSNNS